MKILGHRGCVMPNEAYQNSLDAFKLAINHAEGFECDACLSADGDIFFIHEEITEENGNPTSSLKEHLNETSLKKIGEKHLNELSTAEIKTLQLKDGRPLPAWDETLELFTKNPSKTFNIELKGENVAPVAIQKLKEALEKGKILPEQLVISSFNHPCLLDVKNALPNIKIGALFTASFKEKQKLTPNNTDTEGFYHPFTEENLSRPLIQKINPNFIIVPHTELHEKQVQMVKKHYPNAQMVVWVCAEYNNFNAADFDEKVNKLKGNPALAAIIVDKIK